MASNDEQVQHGHRVTSGCRIAENLVEDKRVAIVGYQILAAVGFVVLALAASGSFAESALLRVVLSLLGGIAIGLGCDAVGRFRGQRQVARWWRQSLEQPHTGRPGGSSPSLEDIADAIRFGADIRARESVAPQKFRRRARNR